MAENFEITPEMRDAVGVVSEPWRYEVTTTGIRAFARGVGYSDLAYYDETAARSEGYSDLPAPPTFLGTPVFFPGVSHEFLPGPPNAPQIEGLPPGVLDGGTEIAYRRRVVAGEVLSVTTGIVELQTKESAALGTMVLLTAETVFKDADGEEVASERAQVIHY